MDAGAAGPVLQSGDQAVFLRVFSGEGNVALVDGVELGRIGDLTVPVAAGDTLLAPPGIHYRISNSSAEPLEISEHRISPEVAFV
jgi:mannose-6-phosphate isomerase-like protein (cupin superfamily)